MVIITFSSRNSHFAANIIFLGKMLLMVLCSTMRMREKNAPTEEEFARSVFWHTYKSSYIFC